MWRKENLAGWLELCTIGPALAAGCLLFLASYGLSLLLDRLGMNPASTFLDDLAIGILGALLLAYHLHASHVSQDLARVKERFVLLAELNHHIRNALTVIRHSAILDDQEKSLRLLDEAIARIERVLTDLVPTVGSAESARFFLAGQKESPPGS
jgi:signal transduction histidine kinase